MDISTLKTQTSVILLCAGDSTRFCQDSLPKKQWLWSEQSPLWEIVAKKFLALGFERIILTFGAKEVNLAKKFGFCVLEGGQTRTQSILNALQKIDTPYVLISDVARWNLQPQVIENLFEALSKDPSLSCVAPSLKVADTLFCTQGNYPNREEFKLIQTPQLSHTQTLKTALQQGEFSDESSAIYHLNQKVAYVNGSPLLHKLTLPQDLQTLTLPKPSTQTFIGNGVDIHAFENDKAMFLCGIEIPSSFGFKAHSDGDVALHSIIDALLGAIGAGDIGEWFPDTQEKYKNVDSKLLLGEVVEFVKNVGYEIVNVDLTILAQVPKITPHKEAMIHSLSTLLNLPLYRINLKATTGEEMGFVGRKEGVCVLSSVSVRFLDWSCE